MNPDAEAMWGKTRCSDRSPDDPFERKLALGGWLDSVSDRGTLFDSKSCRCLGRSLLRCQGIGRSRIRVSRQEPPVTRTDEIRLTRVGSKQPNSETLERRSRNASNEGLGFLVTAASIVLLFISTPSSAQTSLGTAAGFGVLAGSTVTNTGPSVIEGNVGVSPGTAVVGFPPGVVMPPSTIHSADAVAAQAQVDLTTAYDAIAGTPTLVDLTGTDLGGLTLTPGVYGFTSSAQLTGTLTLDALGDPDAVFLFKTGSTLTTASNSSVVRIGNPRGLRSVQWVGGR